MQTFLPYPNFVDSASVLDRLRLGKQRVECLQILSALVPNSTSGWKNHPAVKMWKNHEVALFRYTYCICTEWVDRGYKDTTFAKFSNIFDDNFSMKTSSLADPNWLFDENFHASHRSNLLRKSPEWYGKFGWIEPNDLPYIWPV
jgi:hypothetical protein